MLTWRNTKADEWKKIQIKPAIEERPPLDVKVEGDDRYDYRLRQDMKIHKGTGRWQMGRLVVQATQPQSLKLPNCRGPDTDRIPTTNVTINVRFDPVVESAPPPALTTLKTKLRVATGFAVVPMDEIPTKHAQWVANTNHRGLFVETLKLSSHPMSNIEWQKHTDQAYLNPRDAEIPQPSQAYAYKIGGTFYTCRVPVPVSLVKEGKNFVPTFNSCFISTMYTLELVLSFSTPKWTITDPKANLTLPIQVCCDANPNAEPTDFAEVSFHPRYDKVSFQMSSCRLFADPGYCPQEEPTIPAPEASTHHDPHDVVAPLPEYTEQGHPDASPTRSTAPAISRNGRGGARMDRVRSRHQSLTFEGEDVPLLPEYDQIEGSSRRQNVASSVVPTSVKKKIAKVARKVVSTVIGRGRTA